MFYRIRIPKGMYRQRYEQKTKLPRKEAEKNPPPLQGMFGMTGGVVVRKFTT